MGMFDARAMVADGCVGMIGRATGRTGGARFGKGWVGLLALRRWEVFDWERGWSCDFSADTRARDNRSPCPKISDLTINESTLGHGNCEEIRTDCAGCGDHDDFHF